MYTRFLTYDLQYADNEDYDALYELIGNYKGEKITQSTYKIVTNDNWQTFREKFRKVTNTGDRVYAIVLNNNKVDCFEIRG